MSQVGKIRPRKLGGNLKYVQDTKQRGYSNSHSNDTTSEVSGALGFGWEEETEQVENLPFPAVQIHLSENDRAYCRPRGA
jgi:hypothetical protein